MEDTIVDPNGQRAGQWSVTIVTLTNSILRLTGWIGPDKLVANDKLLTLDTKRWALCSNALLGFVFEFRLCMQIWVFCQKIVVEKSDKC